MSTAEKIIIGLLIVGLVIVGFIAFGKPKNKPIVVDPGNGQPPVLCKPNDPGYTIDGILNPLCGTPICDPNRDGWNLQGFLDPVNCGAGRVRN